MDNENEEEVIGMPKHQDAVFNYELKVEDVAKTFVQLDALREDADVTPMKLQKLLYLAQANYLASTGRRLFNEPVEAYKHGPVVYRAWKMFPGHQIIATQDASSYSDGKALPEDVETFIGQVWERYKDLSAAALRRLTHHQEPWTRNYVEDAYRPEIPDADMVEFFRDKVPAKDRVFHSAVVMVPEGFVEAADENEDEIVLRLSRLFEK